MENVQRNATSASSAAMIARIRHAQLGAVVSANQLNASLNASIQSVPCLVLLSATFAKSPVKTNAYIQSVQNDVPSLAIENSVLSLVKRSLNVTTNASASAEKSVQKSVGHANLTMICSKQLSSEMKAKMLDS